MKAYLIGFATLFMMACSSIASAQEMPAPPKEMEHLKGDVGTWDCQIKVWGDPAGEPQVSKGTETNEMLGGMWLVSRFKGDMMGMPFEGSSQTSFNPETKKYTGTWIDSMSPHAMNVEGTFDEKTQTLTQIGTGKGPDGSEMKTKMTLVKNKDGSRLFTMYLAMPNDESMKMMEIVYTKAKGGESKSATAK